MSNLSSISSSNPITPPPTTSDSVQSTHSNTDDIEIIIEDTAPRASLHHGAESPSIESLHEVDNLHLDLSTDALKENLGKATKSEKIAHRLMRIVSKIIPAFRDSNTAASVFKAIKKEAEKLQEAQRENPYSAQSKEHLTQLRELLGQLKDVSEGNQSSKVRTRLHGIDRLNNFIDQRLQDPRFETEDVTIDSSVDEISLQEEDEVEAIESDFLRELRSIQLKPVEAPDKSGISPEVELEFAHKSFWDSMTLDSHTEGDHAEAIKFEDLTVDRFTQPNESGETLLESIYQFVEKLHTGRLNTSTPKNILKALGHEFGDKLVSHFNQLEEPEKIALITSHGEKFIEELCAHASMQFHPDEEYTRVAVLPEIFKAALSYAIDKIQDGEMTGPDSMIFKGETYNHVKVLGRGGFGSVSLYESAKGERIAVKTPLILDPTTITTEDKLKHFKSTCQEIRNHYAAYHTAPESMVGLLGVIRTKDDKLVTVMQVAAPKNLGNISKDIGSMEKQGILYPETANKLRTLLTRDALKAISDLHEKSGMIHLDVKGPNFFLSFSGKVLLGDFGTSKRSLEVMTQEHGVDNPMWLAPEIMVQRVANNAYISQFPKELRYKAREELSNHLEIHGPDSQVPWIPSTQLLEECLEKEDFKDFQNTKRSIPDHLRLSDDPMKIGITHASDIWSAGVTAFELFHERYPFHHEFVYRIERMITDFANHTESTIRELGSIKNALTEEYEKETMGVTGLDRALLAMLHPDPSQRVSLSQVLKLSIFEDPDLDQPYLRAIIQELASDSPDLNMIKDLNIKFGV